MAFAIANTLTDTRAPCLFVLLVVVGACFANNLDLDDTGLDSVAPASDASQSFNEVPEETSAEVRISDDNEPSNSKREPKFIMSLLNSLTGTTANGVGRFGSRASYNEEDRNSTSVDVGSSAEGISARINDLLTDITSRDGYRSYSNNNKNEQLSSDEDSFPSFFNLLKGLRGKSSSKLGLISANNEPQVMTKVSSVRNTHKPFGPLVQLNPQFSFTLGSHLTPGAYLPSPSSAAAVAPAASQASSSEVPQSKPAPFVPNNPSPAVSLVYPPVSSDEFQNSGYGSSVNHQDSYQPPPTYQSHDYDTPVPQQKPSKTKPAVIHRPSHHAVHVHPHFQQSVPQVAEHVQIGSYIGSPGYSPFNRVDVPEEAQAIACGLRYGLPPCGASQGLNQGINNLRFQNLHHNRQATTWRQPVRRSSVEEAGRHEAHNERYHAFTDVEFQLPSQHAGSSQYISLLPTSRLADSQATKPVSAEPRPVQYITLLPQQHQQRRHQAEQPQYQMLKDISLAPATAESVQMFPEHGDNLGPIIVRRLPAHSSVVASTKVASPSSAPKNQPASSGTDHQQVQNSLQLVQTRMPSVVAQPSSGTVESNVNQAPNHATENSQHVSFAEAPVASAPDQAPSSHLTNVQFVDTPMKGDDVFEYFLVPQGSIMPAGIPAISSQQRLIDGRGRHQGYIRIAKSLPGSNGPEEEKLEKEVEIAEENEVAKSE